MLTLVDSNRSDHLIRQQLLQSWCEAGPARLLDCPSTPYPIDTRNLGQSVPADVRATPAAFTVDGPHAASDATRIDTGANLAVSQNAWMFASFDGEFSSRSQGYAGKTGAKMSWWLKGSLLLSPLGAFFFSD